MTTCLLCGAAATLQERGYPDSTYCSRQCCELLLVGARTRRDARLEPGRRPTQVVTIRRNPTKTTEERGLEKILKLPIARQGVPITYKMDIVKLNTIDDDMFNYLLTVPTCDGVPFQYYKESVREVKDLPNVFMVLCMVRQVIKGFAICHYLQPNGDPYPIQGQGSVPRIVKLELICTPPGMGMGRQLMNILNDYLFDSCTYLVELCALEDAVPFYLSMGYLGISSKDGTLIAKPQEMSVKAYKKLMDKNGIYGPDTGYKMGMRRTVSRSCDFDPPNFRTTGCE